MILTFVSMIQPDDEDFKVYSIKASDFHKMLRIKGRENYDRIHNMTKQLMSRTIEIKRKNGGYLLVNWTSHIEYIPGEARIEFSFDPKLKPYLLQLKRAFKSYRLENILSLNSYYSIRLYELLKKWENLVNWETSLEHLKSLLGIYQKSYELYGNFKNKILNPAMIELQEKTDIKPSFVEVKSGRKITGIIFTVKTSKDKTRKEENGESEVQINNSEKRNKSLLLEKMNMKALNFVITQNAFSIINSIANRIYNKDKIDNELMNLVRLANLKAETNPIGFMIHIIRDKEKIYNAGDDPSIELDLIVHTKEIIPDWFKERKNTMVDIEKTTEDLKGEEKESKEMLELLRRHVTTP